MRMLVPSLRALAAFVIISVFVGLIYLFYIFVRGQLTDELYFNAQNRTSIFAGTIKGDLQRHTIVPRILDRDFRFAQSLIEYDQSLNEELARISAELDSANIYSLGLNGRIVNASDESLLGRSFDRLDILNLARNNGGAEYYDTESFRYYVIRSITSVNRLATLGYIVVEVDFLRYSTTWNRLGVNIAMSRPTGEILIANDTRFIDRNIKEIVGLSDDTELLPQSLGKLFAIDQLDYYVFQAELGLNGWKIIYFTPAEETQRKISGYVALLIFALAFLLVLVLYFFSRRAARSSTKFRRESEELRALNARLISEIEQRRQAEKSLQFAEQSLEQSSKLAVIGRMSAAVGHELNQPLAAMRTYMAGVRALLRRSRFAEAGQNLNRIEDLIDRMGSITRQMRSFARAHETNIIEFDLREALQNALALMAPQLGMMRVEVQKNVPDHAVIVVGDMVRVEQILINLMRNALEASSGVEEPLMTIDLELRDKTAQVLISDNGLGFEDADKLFEPFYTTKPPGEGLGLGLAISASYARDMGGNLLARANNPNGAVFELNLMRSDPN